MQHKNPILLNPEDYKNIKYKGLHRQKTIDESNKEISKIIKNFNEFYSQKFKSLNEKLNLIVDNLIKEYSESNRKNLLSFLTKKIDYKSIEEYFEISVQKLKFYIGKGAPKYSPKDLVKEFSKCFESSLKELDNSINEYTKKFKSEIGEYGQSIEQNKKKIEERFDKTTKELNIDFSTKMDEITTKCLKKSEEFENTKTKETRESWSEKITGAKNKFDNHIEEYAINMFLKGDKDLEASAEETELKSEMDKILTKYKRELEKNIKEYIEQKEKEKEKEKEEQTKNNPENFLNDEKEFKINLSSCKSLINDWYAKLQEHSKKYEKSSGGKGTVAYTVTTATKRFEELTINPNSLKNVGKDVWDYVNNIISATLSQDDLIKKLGITNIKNCKFPGEYKEITNTDAKKAILCLIKIAISSDLKKKPFIDNYIKNLENKTQSSKQMVKPLAAPRSKKKRKK